MEPIQQVCVNAPEYIAGIIGSIVVGASTLANFVPAPDKISNPAFKVLNRVLHFVSMDIVTAAKK